MPLTEEFHISINGITYLVNSDDHVDQIFFHITKDGKELCIVSTNEDGEWESNCDIDGKLVQDIGQQIESHNL